MNRSPAPAPGLQRFAPPLLLGLAAVILVLIAYTALDAPLVLDSVKLYSLETLVREHGNLAIFHTPAFGDWFGRILSMASFVLNVQVEGDISAPQLRATNLAIHLLCAWAAFTLVRELVQLSPYAGQATPIALATALLWLLSPANFNVVMYTVQRMAQLSALFTLLGLIAYTRARVRAAGTPWRFVRFGLAGLCLVLAVASKQNGVLLIPLVILLEIYFLNIHRQRFDRRHFLLLLGVGLAAAVLLLYVAPGLVSYASRDFTMTERLLSQPRALMSYIQNLLFPLGGDTELFNDGFPVSKGLLEPVSTLLSLLAVSGLLLFAVLARQGRLRLAAFGLAFFFTGHLLESTLFPLEIYFLHRNYLPAVGLYLALVALAVAFVPARRWPPLLLFILVLYYAVVDHARALTWRTPETLYASAVHHHPESGRALAAYAQLALGRGDYDLALAAVDRRIALKDSPASRVQRLFILCVQGKPIDAAEYRALASARGLDLPIVLSQSLGNLLNIYEKSQCPQLDVDGLVETLDSLAAREEGDAWHIAYHVNGFLYAGGEKERAYARLTARMEAGDPRSGLALVELQLREKDGPRAAATLDRLTQTIDATKAATYAGDIEAFRRQIDKLTRP